MEVMLLPILAAAAVMLLVWGGTQALASLTDAQKRKLKQRLSTGGRLDDASAIAQRNILMQQQELDGMSAALLRISLFERLNRLLVHAYPDVTLGRFLLVVAGIAVGMFLLCLLISGSILVSAVAGGIGIYAPCVVLSSKRARRQRLLADQLPEALDFLGRILKAGHSLSTGIQMMGEELPQPLAGEFRRAYDQHSLGQPMEQVLREMAKRIESTDFAFFVTATLIQRQTGGDLSEVLGNISDMIRQRIRLQQHVKAKTAEGRLTGYILTAFPAVMFVIAYVLNPEYAGVLIHTGTGLMLLGVAFGLQLLGLYFIKKITTVVV
ncbi:type II secretion system F family protein [Fontivita pretiosa]|uniref:type II secretion system F family protein n=1 Tax=Fontivita pretiosa TaxID=2989684 RepID=UPI003D172D9D